jgi:hypothetical protein
MRQPSPGSFPQQHWFANGEVIAILSTNSDHPVLKAKLSQLFSSLKEPAAETTQLSRHLLMPIYQVAVPVVLASCSKSQNPMNESIKSLESREVI